jgi:hypothetical protein
MGPTTKGPKIEGPKMAKIAKKLTDTEIKSTKPAAKEINLFDGDGLILRILPSRKEGRRIGISDMQYR